MAAENIIFNRRATLAWQSSSPGSRQAQPVQIDPSIALRLRLEASPGGRPAPGRARARRRATPLQVLHDIGVPRRTVREPPQALGTCGPERPAGKDAASDRPRPAACGRRARHGHHDGISLVKGGGCHSGTPCALSVDVLRVLRSRPAQQASQASAGFPGFPTSILPQ
jgi:hypothetical protein